MKLKDWLQLIAHSILIISTVLIIETPSATVTTNHYARLNTQTGLLHLPVVDVLDKTGKVAATYQVDLQKVESQNFNFELSDFELLESNKGFKALPATYDPNTHLAEIPGLYVSDKTGIHSFQARLKRLSGTQALQFAIVDLVKLPRFEGIALLNPVSTEAIKLAWLPVTTHTTPERAMAYEIHLATQPHFIPDSTTLYVTVIGNTEYELTGLQSDTVYYVLIVARDQQNHASLERRYRRVKTFAKPVKLNPTTTFVTTEDLHLGKPLRQNDPTEYVFQMHSGTKAPKVGSVLIGTQDQGGYLRQVAAVETRGQELIVQTRAAALSDIVEQGMISTNILLLDVDKAAQSQQLNSRRQRSAAGGNQVSQVRWPSGLLRAEKTGFILNTPDTQFNPAPEPGRYQLRALPHNQRQPKSSIPIDLDTGHGIHLEADLEFSPEFISEMEWDIERKGLWDVEVKLQSAQLKAQGTLQLNATIQYDFERPTTYEKTVRFFKTVYNAVYTIPSVPPIPVYQTITVTLEAQFSAEALSQVEVATETRTEAQVEFGAEYNPETQQWETLAIQDFDNELAVSLGVAGGVETEVRFIPTIEVEFYKVVAGHLSIEPYLGHEMRYGFAIEKDLGGETTITFPQLMAFDVDLGVDFFVGAQLDMLFKKIPLLEKTKITRLNFNLFSLPELTLNPIPDEVKALQTILLTAEVEDGTNNPFEPESVQWFVYPDRLIEVDPQNPYQARFTPTQSGDYWIIFSGYGHLGEMGRRYAVWLLTVTAPSSTGPTLGEGTDLSLEFL